ncbi:MAG: peptidoglycan DD-metalloendopeptidase family protein [Magnetococcus sp. WYHC-3]
MAPPPSQRRCRCRSVFVTLLLAVLWTVWCGAAHCAPAEAPQLERSRAQLEDINRSLREETQALERAGRREQGLLDELQRLDRELADANTRVEEVARELQSAQGQTAGVQERVAVQRRQQAAQLQRLNRHLQLMYAMGTQGPLRAVLGQGDLASARRAVHYLGYLVQARNEELARFRQSTQRLDASLDDHRTHQERLSALAASLDGRQRELAQSRAQRAALLERARDEHQSLSRKVTELQRAREDLSRFVTRLEEQLAARLEEEIRRVRIEDRRGSLTPPLPGRPEEQGRGVFFAARRGQPVVAVFRGRVVYADWFRGYGRLLILHHGDQVYSLYGHNHQLNVGLGDWVDAGDTIAEAGETGSLEGRPGVYFELRKNSRPVNPLSWLARSGGEKP